MNILFTAYERASREMSSWNFISLQKSLVGCAGKPIMFSPALSWLLCGLFVGRIVQESWLIVIYSL